MFDSNSTGLSINQVLKEFFSLLHQVSNNGSLSSKHVG